MNRFHRALVLALVPAFVGIGCAQNVGDINRTQGNFVRKADFEGEWYIRTTIADVPPMSGLGFVGLQLEMEKVRWEITESHLIAYRSHERYPGLNPMVDHDSKRIGNTPLRDSADDGHFGDYYKDAPIAAYPILSHFDVQRQYNTATGEQTNVIVENTSDRLWHERDYMRVNWSVNHIRNLTGSIVPNAGWLDFAQWIPEEVGGAWGFRMERRNGDGSWITHVADPTREEFDPDARAEYLDFTARLFVAPPTINFGGTLYPACYLIAGTYDCTSSEVKVRTSIMKVPEERTFHPRVYDDHDMMKFGFFRTDRQIFSRRHGETDRGVLRFANIHNVWENAYGEDGQVLPYQDRTPKPIYYTLSPNYPEDLLPEAEQMARNWSRALARAVAGAQRRDLESVEAEFPTDRGGEYVNEGLFRLDYNEDGEARIGDLRHNFIYWVDQPQLSAPLGYGPSSADPETGEIISGQAFVYGASVDRLAQSALEIVAALMGDYDVDEISTGEDVKFFLEQHSDRVDPRGFHMRHDHHPHGGLDLHDMPIDALRLDRLDPEKAARFEAIRQIGLDDPLFESRDRRMKRLEGTRFESLLVNDEIRAVLPTPELARAGLNEDVIEAARPLTTDIFRSMRDAQQRQEWASHHCVWLLEFSDPSVLGLARYIKSKMEDDGWSYDDAYQFLRKQTYYSVMDHEIGHTMGLRHNFQGTFDSINYFDEYWNLRRENLDANPQTFADLDEMSRLTEDQIDGRMREYQYSSIMDYSARFYSGSTKGLGRYDEAAVMFAYGEAVEVFETAGAQFRNRYFQQYSDGASRFEERGSPAYEHFLDVTHYTRVPFLLGDGNLNEGLQRLRTRRKMPYSTVQAMRDPSHPEHANRWVEVPYMFCSDEQVGIQASCHRWVEGADVWEQSQNLIESWNNYYWFSNFRRERWGWQASSVLNRSFGRYFAYFPNFYQHWLFGVYAFGTVDEPLQQIYMQNAAIEGVNFLADVIATPSYGSFRYDAIDNQYVRTSYLERADADLFIPRGMGRRPSSSYDWNAGYYYYWYQQEAGHFWDYLAALFALSESEARVMGVDTQADFQSYVIPYYLVFNDELDRLYNGVFASDHRDFAPRLVDGQLVYRPLVDLYGQYDDDDPFITDEPVVAPSHTSSVQFYTLIYGMLGFVNTLDLGFADQHRIFRLGTDETHEPGAGFELVTFENPFTGIVYGALHQTGEPPSGAVRMIQKANEMKQRYDDGQVQQWEVTRVVDWMEVQRGLSKVFGSVF